MNSFSRKVLFNSRLCFSHFLYPFWCLKFLGVVDVFNCIIISKSDIYFAFSADDLKYNELRNNWSWGRGGLKVWTEKAWGKIRAGGVISRYKPWYYDLSMLGNTMLMRQFIFK